MKQALKVAVTVFAGLVTYGSAVAQVHYAYPPPDAPINFFSPYDESYGTSPSYQIHPYAYGGPAVRVIERCQYPDGWNVTDFGRDINGIPNGADHACPIRAVGDRIRVRY